MPENNWDGTERRKGYSNLVTDIELIKQEVKHISVVANNNLALHRDNHDRLISLSSLEKRFESHVVSDRWMFGLIISLVIGILAVVINK